MNNVNVSGTIVNLPCRYFKTKNGNKVVNNQIDVARGSGNYSDRIDFTAWGELAELLTKANQDSIVELSGELRVENFTDKSGKKQRKVVILATKVDFSKIDVEEVAEQDFVGENLDNIQISEDDLPF